MNGYLIDSEMASRIADQEKAWKEFARNNRKAWKKFKSWEKYHAKKEAKVNRRQRQMSKKTERILT